MSENAQDQDLAGRRIVLGVTGGIAAYKSCTLCRLLKAAGAQVQVVMTAAAQQFVSAATFAALSGQAVGTDMFSHPERIPHLATMAGANLMVIAPATANTLARLRAGLADDLLSACALGANCPIVVAPAMNSAMYHHPATQENLKVLISRGVLCIPPGTGSLACGGEGQGRMAEPEEIFNFIVALFKGQLPALGYQSAEMLPPPTPAPELTETRLLPRADGAGLKVLITAGPTVEAVDAVRCFTNRSSGKMGFAIARACALHGCEVTLVSGPVALETPAGCRRIDVRSTAEMLQAVEAHADNVDMVIGCAAVADFRPANPDPGKISSKAHPGGLTITLTRNPDIIATVGARTRHRPFTVGFAAQMGPDEAAAREKLTRKHLDLIVLNDVSARDSGFDADFNAATVFDGDGRVATLERKHKSALADELVSLFVQGARVYLKTRA